MNVVVAKQRRVNGLYPGIHCPLYVPFRVLAVSVFVSGGLEGSKRFPDVLMFEGLDSLPGRFEHL